VPLAINTMTQPSGRVLGRPAKYRTYLRCSPLICAADALSIFIHLILYCATFPFAEAVRLLIQERFGDDEKNAGGIQAIEKLTLIRWVFFIFASLGQAINFMAMEGAPWTKAWVAMFLTSFLIVEILVVLSWIYVPHERPLALEGHEAAQLLRIRERLGVADGLLLSWATLFYALVLLWATLDIHDAINPSPTYSNPADYGEPYQTPLRLAFLITSLAVLPISIVIVFSTVGTILITCIPIILSPLKGLPFVGSKGLHQSITKIAAIVHAPLVLVLMGLKFPYAKSMFIWSLLNLALSTIFVSPAVLVFRFWSDHAVSFPRVSKNVFVTWKSEEKALESTREVDNDSADVMMILCFLMFLYSAVLCVIWYWYR
jgi:hypothetical protein